MELKRDIIKILKEVAYPEQSLEDLFEMDWSSSAKNNEVFFLSHDLTLKAELKNDVLTLDDFKVSYFYEEIGNNLIKRILDYSFSSNINKIKINESSEEIKTICNLLNFKKEKDTFVMCFST